jgi:hypothetical protein
MLSPKTGNRKGIVTMFKYHRSAFVSLLCAALVSGCSTVEVFQYQNESRLDHVFIKQGVDFSRYTAVMIDDINVWYPDEFAPSPENADRIRENLALAQDLFRQTIADALDERYQVTDMPGRNVLRVAVEFVDLRAVKGGARVPSELARYEFNAQPGRITMVAQLFDSRSGERLARAADLGKQESIGGDGRVDWNAIAEDFNYWAEVFSAWLSQIHGQEPQE